VRKRQVKLPSLQVKRPERGFGEHFTFERQDRTGNYSITGKRFERTFTKAFTRFPRPVVGHHVNVPARCHSKTMTWTSQSSADATDRAGSTADVACETSCSSLWSLLLGHSWLSSCYRLICRVLYYPNRGAEVRALLTDAQRARVLTLAVVDLVFALSMLPQPPELLPLLVLDWSALESFRLHFNDGLMRVVADDAAATDGNTSELPPSWDLAVEAPAATDLVWMGATNWATRQMLCLTKRARAHGHRVRATSAARERSSGAICLASPPLVADIRRAVGAPGLLTYNIPRATRTTRVHVHQSPSHNATRSDGTWQLSTVSTGGQLAATQNRPAGLTIDLET